MIADGKILVAGGSGFIGGALVRRLIDDGAQVRATHLSHPPNMEHPQLEWIQADLTDAQTCADAVAGVDYVFLCAAATSGAADISSNPLMHVTPNVVLNARVLEASYRARVRKFVYLSSAAAYPPRALHPLTEGEMFNGDPADVYFPAGWMKRYAEILCRTYAEKLSPPMPTVVVRPSNIYGPRDKFDWQRSHVTAALVRRVVERHNPMVIWGTGEVTRDLIYIDDFVNGMLAAFSHDAPSLTVNIASGHGVTVRKILETALEIDDYTEVQIKYDSSKPTTIKELLVDTSLARNLLRFEATTSLEEGLRQTITWLRANPPVA